MILRPPHKSPFIITASIISMVSVTYIGTLLLDRRSVLSIESVVISPNPVRPGETISITWSGVAHRSCDGEVIRQIVDSSGRVFDYARIDTAYHDIAHRGVPKTFTRYLQTPADMAPGPAEYRTIVRRWCNSLQRIFWPMIERGRTGHFTVAGHN